jgi:hypothetical protein
MARVVETEEPVVRERETNIVHDDTPHGSSATAIIAIIILIIVLVILFAWRPWGSNNSTTPVNTPSTGTSSKP